MSAGRGGVRRTLKRGLAVGRGRRAVAGTTILIYHRVGGGSRDELDVPLAAFAAHVEVLRRHRVVSLDTALDELEAGDDSPKVVLTFDDGFSEVGDVAWPLLAGAGLAFTLYLATGYVGAPMRWEGGTGRGDGLGMGWERLAELAASPLVTIGNHTHSHVRPAELGVEELDRCTGLLGERLGVAPRHFAYPWGVRVPAVEELLRERFRSAVTGEVGRNHPGVDPLRLARVPVRASDPIGFFEAKLTGRLLPERAYAAVVSAAKRLGAGR